MTSGIALELILLILLIIANGVFAMSELAMMSARKMRLEQRAQAGDAGAQAALDLINSPNRFLSTVQIGITLIGIFAGAFGGATIAQELNAVLSGLPVVGPYGEEIGVAVVVLATTYLSLVIGELVPKRLALQDAERIAALVARPMRLLSRAVEPVVRLLTFSTEIMLRLLGVRPPDEPPVTDEEVSLLVRQGIQAGVFHQAEHEMIDRILGLDQRRVNRVMTPRTEIVWLDVQDDVRETRRKLAECGYSRLPVCDGDIDHVLGVITATAAWRQIAGGRELDLRSIAESPVFVPENAPLLTLLEILKETRQHVAFAISEHGGVEGLITLTDIMEAIVGALPDSREAAEEPQIVQRPDGSWLIDGLLPLDELADLLDIDEPGTDTGMLGTLGGFVMQQMQRIPGVSESFEWGGYRFEVVDMDGLRVDKVLVARRELPLDAADVRSRSR